MKKAFTLIELVIVMVMASLLLGLLLPTIARSKQAEELTQCRSNLSWIGKAITMYANDNDGYIPEWNGGTWVEKRSDAWGHPNVHDQKNVGKQVAGKWGEDGRSFEEDPFIGAVFGTTMGCKIPGLNNITAPETQWWNCTEARPASPVGLGRLVTQKYMGDKSAELFYCPGNHSWEAAKENDTDIMTAYDPDEPFWTSKGAVVLANGNGIGDLGDVAMKGYGCWTGSKTIDGSHCQIALNYTLRTLKGHYKTILTDRPEHDGGPFGIHTPYDIAIKLVDAGNVGILADSIDPWFGWERVKEKYEPYTGPWPETLEEKYVFARKLARMNHDNAYNVLFADGSVKTFNDTSGKMFNRLVECWLGHNTGGGGSPTGAPDNNCETYTNNFNQDKAMWGDLFIFSVFLDGVYGE